MISNYLKEYFKKNKISQYEMERKMNLLEIFKNLTEEEKQEFVNLLIHEINKKNIEFIRNEKNSYTTKFTTKLEEKD